MSSRDDSKLMKKRQSPSETFESLGTMTGPNKKVPRITTDGYHRSSSYSQTNSTLLTSRGYGSSASKLVHPSVASNSKVYSTNLTKKTDSGLSSAQSMSNPVSSWKRNSKSEANATGSLSSDVGSLSSGISKLKLQNQAEGSKRSSVPISKPASNSTKIKPVSIADSTSKTATSKQEPARVQSSRGRGRGVAHMQSSGHGAPGPSSRSARSQPPLTKGRANPAAKTKIPK